MSVAKNYITEKPKKALSKTKKAKSKPVSKKKAKAQGEVGQNKPANKKVDKPQETIKVVT
eukprot:CAMPEP_0170459038 /NCGR_PEP_ID=MMETSP0123-20130129/5842_1 /TAXON_ID=182087 /ORGANISM="Favella ehrenbergii, Strain Fehren 1" /LENGTH=59 /DNA_ID=CAMNT_0010723455 /DNA_START=784 /DNA_END=963 /DNA_ORIENTATION=+